jgi:histidinol-phosphate/aromatic aminotransferase/cobyric acid decarboxylase-like protein
MIQVLDHIEKMLPYLPPWGKMDRKAYVRMDLNENTNDPPAPVMEALADWAKSGRFQMYPDYAQFMPELA